MDEILGILSFFYQNIGSHYSQAELFLIGIWKGYTNNILKMLIEWIKHIGACVSIRITFDDIKTCFIII